jgi:hypothetical protein
MSYLALAIALFFGAFAFHPSQPAHHAPVVQPLDSTGGGPIGDKPTPPPCRNDCPNDSTGGGPIGH